MFDLFKKKKTEYRHPVRDALKPIDEFNYDYLVALKLRKIADLIERGDVEVSKFEFHLLGYSESVYVNLTPKE